MKKWLKIDRHFLQQKCSQKSLVLSDVSFMAILARDRPPVRALK